MRGGPAGAALVDPVAGRASTCPLNLAAVIVRFPASVSLGRGRGAGLRRSPGGRSPPRRRSRCPATAAAATGSSSRAACRRRSRARVADRRGDHATRAAPPSPVGVDRDLRRGAAADETPPVLGGPGRRCRRPLPDGQLRDRRAARPPPSSMQAGGVEDDEAPAGVGQTRFDVAIPLTALPPRERRDGHRHRRRSRRQRRRVVAAAPSRRRAALPPLAITEVLANAAGPEPAQEYVELRNMGDVERVACGAAAGGREGRRRSTGDARSPAGGYALVVPSGYDAAEGQDPAPRAGTSARADRRPPRRGRPGERRRAWSGCCAADTVVSSYGGWVGVSAGRWAGQGCAPARPERVRSRRRLEPHAARPDPRRAAPAMKEARAKERVRRDSFGPVVKK